MDYESRLSISFYREVATINQEHHIFLVQHLKTHKFYVKKILDVFHTEIYHQLKDHPVKGLPQIYELCEEDGKLIIIEEYISGETFDEYITNHGTLSNTMVADYILQLCDILSQLHQLSPAIIHRDIKPSNVMITTFGKFLDPIADKLLVNTMFIIFAAQGVVPIVAVLIMIWRDTIVDAVRMLISQKGLVLAAEYLGKVKTVAQMLAIILVLLNNVPFEFYNIPVMSIMVWFATLMSVLSGASYVIQSRSYFMETM